MSEAESRGQLSRVVGVPGAVLMGLGSILGTGIFVSIGIAAGVTGSSVVLAVTLGALVATFNGLSSAQLAASHPVSGGTYEYGYRYLDARLGFTAGWMFLSAKSASAATAALGFAGYVLTAFGITDAQSRTAVAVAGIVVLTAIVAGGMHRSNRTNAVIVGITLLTLVAFVLFGTLRLLEGPRFEVGALVEPSNGMPALLHATALMFVAYTGYGRIATLGEEIRDPERNIPRAIVITLLASMAIYVGVTLVAVGTLGADGLADATKSAAAPLEIAARTFGVDAIRWLVALGAVTAMLGVLLNLLLGLSRVLLAMARRGDMPRGLAHVSGRHTSPRRAVIVTGILVAGLALIGRIEVTWSFSAFTVLVYYALTNLAALRLPPQQRRYPRWVPVAGLICCSGLAFWVDTTIWAAGLALILIGWIWHTIATRISSRDRPTDR